MHVVIQSIQADAPISRHWLRTKVVNISNQCMDSSDSQLRRLNMQRSFVVGCNDFNGLTSHMLLLTAGEAGQVFRVSEYLT